MKIVIDTNVVASAIFFGGYPGALIELVVSKKLDAYAEIITEYQETTEELCNKYPEKSVKLQSSFRDTYNQHLNNLTTPFGELFLSPVL